MFRASARTVLVSLALALVAVANTSVTARALGVEGRGLLAAAILVVSLAKGVALLGLGEAFVFRTKNAGLRGDIRKHLSAALALVIVLGGVTTAALLPFGPLRHVLLAAAITVVLGGVWTGYDFLIASARVQPEMRVFNWLRAIGPSFATLSIIVVWAFVPMEVAIVLSLQTACMLLAGVMGYLALRRVLDCTLEPSSTVGLSVPEFLRSGIGYQGIAISSLILSYAHMYIVMLLGTLGAFGIYSAAFGLSRMVAPVQLSIGYAVFATSAGSDETDRGAAAMRALRVTFLPLLILACLIAVLAPWVVRVVLGSEFVSAALPFAVLTIEAVVAGAAFILGQHLQAAGRVRTVLALNLLSMIPILLGVIILGGSSVVIGMAWLMLVASCVRLIATLLVYRKLFRIGVWRVLPTGADFALLITLLRGLR